MDRPFILDTRRASAQGLLGLWGPGSPSGTAVFDRAGRALHGSMEGMAPSSDWVLDPDRGWVWDFDGTNDVVRIDNSNAAGHVLDFTAGPFSMMAWIKMDVATGSIISKRDASLTQYQFYVDSATDKLRFSAASEYGYGDTVLTTATWYHVGVGVDASEDPELFLDGQSDGFTFGSGASPMVFTHRGIDVSIGARWQFSPTTGYQFNGQIGDVRIYNRALPEAEWNHIYRSTLVEPYGDLLLQPRRVFKAAVAPPAGAIMNQIQGANLGADLFDGTLLV